MHAQRMHSKISEVLEVVAAVIVTTGLVDGNLLLFAQVRIEKRGNTGVSVCEVFR